MEKVWMASFHMTGTTQQWHMRLANDHEPRSWNDFHRLANIRFGSPTHHNLLGELAALWKTGSVDGYTEKFLALLARAGKLDRLQQVNIYTASLKEPLKTDVELQEPKDPESTMSLARA
uniref:Retrotransposon gag domain-containing protein n=1 Tax=Arundo donax TaxID=35708 RepID=A0A0A9A0C4_ARUDO